MIFFQEYLILKDFFLSKRTSSLKTTREKSTQYFINNILHSTNRGPKFLKTICTISEGYTKKNKLMNGKSHFKILH